MAIAFVIAYARDGVARKCIAVLAARSAMGVVVLAEGFLVCTCVLLADIAFAHFVDTRTFGTDLLGRARFASAAVDATCRVTLRTRTLPV